MSDSPKSFSFKFVGSISPGPPSEKLTRICSDLYFTRGPSRPVWATQDILRDLGLPTLSAESKQALDDLLLRIRTPGGYVLKQEDVVLLSEMEQLGVLRRIGLTFDPSPGVDVEELELSCEPVTFTKDVK